MTAAEMHIGVSLGLQRVGAHSYGDFLSEEIDYYLNQAALKVVRMKVAEEPPNENDVRTLVSRTVVPMTPTVGMTKLWDGPVPPNFLAPLTARVVLDHSAEFFALANQDSLGHFIRADQAYMFIPKFSDRALFRDTPIYIEGNKFVAIGDHRVVDIKQIDVVWVGLPNKISLSVPTASNTPSHIHQEIVDAAVLIMTGDLQRGQPQ